ncbi:hypothetical protein ZWY2020_006818 [Hordeum vulgare]|nr:hypothetical protein ZWY2020_006818 [Hordeum vulgare]
MYGVLERTRPQITCLKRTYINPTTIAASGGSSHGRTWPDLHPEMSGDVLARLPSHTDRARFAAVCRPWRSSARLQRLLPPPRGSPMRWHLLASRRRPSPARHDNVSSRVSNGSALFLVHGDDDKCSAAGWFQENPTVQNELMSDHHVAALVEATISGGQQGDTTRCSRTDWAESEDIFVHDIALFKGKFYVLLDTGDAENGQEHELHTLDDGHEQIAIPGTRVHGLDDSFHPDVRVTAPLAASGTAADGATKDRLICQRRLLPVSPGSIFWRPSSGDCIYFISEETYQTVAVPAAGEGPWSPTWLFPET